MLDEESLKVITAFTSDLGELLGKGKPIDPMPNYAHVVELFESVRVHSQLSSFPTKLISESAPNETEAEFEYKMTTYQPTTRPIWKEATTQINRIFNRQNFSIKGWGNDKGIYQNVAAQDYFEQDFPRSQNILSYFENIVKPAKDEDPNALLCLDLVDVEFPDTELPEPYLKIYHCEKVMMKESNLALVLTDEKSQVKFNNTTERSGYVFKLYDTDAIYRVVQYGEREEYLFSVELYYEHNLGYLPCEYLKGQPKIDGSNEYYESLFMDAVPLLNDVTIDSTNLRVNKVSNLFMERIEWVDECDFEGCENGTVYDIDEEGVRRGANCPACHGNGKRSMMSPLGVTQVQLPTRMNDFETLPFDPVTYVKKDSSMIEALRKEINYNIENSFSFMGIEISPDKKSGKETATSKLIDRESLFSFISLYSNQMFDLIGWSIQMLGDVRYPDFVMPEVRRPISFALRSESDLAAELQESEALPDAVRSQMTKEYLNVRFANNSKLKATIDLKEKLDAYYLQSPESVLALMASNVYPKWKATLHFSFDSYIAQQPDSFFELDFESQKAQLEQMAKNETGQMQMTTDQILQGDGIQDDEANDVEAEAKARLKGSVGGVQGMLEIQSSVSQGITDYSAGIAILKEIYGFDDALARAVLGTPKKAKPLDADA